MRESVVPAARPELKHHAGRRLEGGGVLLARLTDDRSPSLEAGDVFGDGTGDEADEEIVGAHLASVAAGGAGLRLGMLTIVSSLPADLAAARFGRHGFLCGQSSSGKTYPMDRILEHSLQTR